VEQAGAGSRHQSDARVVLVLVAVVTVPRAVSAAEVLLGSKFCALQEGQR